jgi:hypothetical protein
VRREFRKVIHPVLFVRRAEGIHVEANVFAILAITISFKRAHLIERAAKVRASRFIGYDCASRVLPIQIFRL